MFAAIGYGGMTATRAANRIKDEVTKASRPIHKSALDKLNEQVERRSHQKNSKNAQGVLVEGLDNCLIKFSRCCTPVPGDDIIGFITRGYGVSIHRTDCANYLNNKDNPNDAGRWITVSWLESPQTSYTTTLKILSKERNGLVMDIATVLNSLNAKVRSLYAYNMDGGKSTVTVTLEVAGLADLQNIMNRLSGISGITEISRSNG